IARAAATGTGTSNGRSVQLQDARFFMGVRDFNQVLNWHHLPDGIDVAGLNKSHVIVGNTTSGGQKVGYYRQVYDDGSVSDMTFISHPFSGAAGTEVRGISDNGLICGTYDLVHPFIYQIFPA